jgi:DNA invertase Pin-like site-specific DNA recombinase
VINQTKVQAMAKAVFYLRVSTIGQVTDGVGLDTQLAKLNAWAALHDAEVIGSFSDEGISGTREDRPGLESAIALACKERAALVVYSLSRLSRSTSHTIKLADRLAKSGADLISLSEALDTSSAAGRMVFRMLATLAEFERDLCAERTTAALAHKKAKGERTGSVPFGYDLADNGINLVPNAGQQEALELIAELRAAGLSMRSIADQLNARNIPTAKGKGQWKHSTIQSILNRAA